jgi:diguanylate cyclase (GGDEF)-like protein
MDDPINNQQPPTPSTWGTLASVVSDGLMLIDADDCVTMINPAAAHILSLRSDSLIGCPISEVIPFAHNNDNGTTQIVIGGDIYSLSRTSLGEQGALLLIQPTQNTRRVTRQLNREQQLRRLTMAISSALDIETLLGLATQLSIELIDSDAGALTIYESERDCTHIAKIINLPPATIASPHYRGTDVIWDLIDSGRSFVINDYQHEPQALPSLVDLGVKAVIAAPVRAADKILGAIILYQTTPDKAFSQHDRELLEVVGRQTGIALQNARLYEEAIRESDRRHLLYAASVEIGAALDPENLYHAIHRAASRLMICDSFAIALYDEEHQEIAYVYIADHQGRWPARRIPLGRGLLGHIIRTNVSLRLSNSDPEIEAIFGAERLHGDADVTRSILATVMNTGEHIVGAITVQAHAPFAYTSKDLEALEMLASTAAIATQNARLFARIQMMATIDPLTQIPNRRHFFDVASREVDRTDRYKRPVSLIMFDIDSFKAVNDTYGHLAGDQVLKMVAARCRDDLRDTDTVARYGGEEFVVLMPETSYAQAIQVAQRLLICIGDLPIDSDVGPIPITVSIGVESCDELFIGSLKDLLDRADQALYTAKNCGRNQVVGFRSLIFERNEANQPSVRLKNEARR